LKHPSTGKASHLSWKSTVSEDSGLLGIITRAFRGRDRRLCALEERLASLEVRMKERPANLADYFKGPYIEGTLYRRGEMALRQGACWLSLTDQNDGLPGQSETWRMISKSYKSR
jgi:hypothetical protein